MLEVTEDDVGKLSDTDFRELINRLVIAELESNGCPRSAVTAGGHQDASDGGIDVRVECPTAIKSPDFVPCRVVGIQVKASKMNVAKIRDEMRKDGVLKDSIREIFEASGAYVIVCSKENLTDEKMRDRVAAMEEARDSVAGISSGVVRFYDRQTVVSWTNKYPGVVAWVRKRSFRDTSGWMSVDDLPDVYGVRQQLFHSDDPIVYANSSHERLSLIQVIGRLRTELRTAGKCIRIIGLSGTGKTRLVKALFEEGVGVDPLDASLSVCADFSTDPSPSVINMAQGLINNGRRTILVVDNCNPTTHSELTKICSASGSNISLLTVEYDVRDDEPELTSVYRIDGAPAEVLIKWISFHFPKLSDLDCRKISEYSGGNYRVAFAIAEKVREGETLGRLKARDLFERIFEQRSEIGRSVRRSAGAVALFYSINYRDDSAEGELAKLGFIHGSSPGTIFEDIREMHSRQVLQFRGRYAAILPEAIANHLACEQVKSIQPGRLDEFCASLTPRMFKSLCRRFSSLHDSVEVKDSVSRWLRVDGPLGDILNSKDGLSVIALLAPIDPVLVLERLEQEFRVNPLKQLDSDDLHQLLRLIKQIAYNDALFERAAFMYACIVSAQTKLGMDGQVGEMFAELFHIHLSGTQALPLTRRRLIARLSKNPTFIKRECVVAAIRGLLKSGNFTLFCDSGFGARPRDYGWRPVSQADVNEWYDLAIRLAVEVAPGESREILADAFHGIWRLRESMRHAVSVLSQGAPWIEGWVAALRLISNSWHKLAEGDRAWLVDLIGSLKPTSAVCLARVVVFNPFVVNALWEFDYDDDSVMARVAGLKSNCLAEEAGGLLAADSVGLSGFIPELMSKAGDNASYRFGLGLANGSSDHLSLWNQLIGAYARSDSPVRNVEVLRGFLAGVSKVDSRLVVSVTENVERDEALRHLFVPLKSAIGLDENFATQVLLALERGALPASGFWYIANRIICDVHNAELMHLILRISLLEGGRQPALKMIYAILSHDGGKYCNDPMVISAGRSLLLNTDFADYNDIRDYELSLVVKYCLAGQDGMAAARSFVLLIQDTFHKGTISVSSLSQTWASILSVQPAVVLDVFLLCPKDCLTRLMFDEVPVDILIEWAASDPPCRYPLLAEGISMFRKPKHDSPEVLSETFAALSNAAPDSASFLEASLWGLALGGWSGSAVVILSRRRELLADFLKEFDSRTAGVRESAMRHLDGTIQFWLDYERDRDARFE